MFLIIKLQIHKTIKLQFLQHQDNQVHYLKMDLIKQL
jgi:hypothetical protein